MNNNVNVNVNANVDANANVSMNVNENIKNNRFNIQHVVVYSSLSKCRIWPKILKSGIGFVPTLINFYNNFTK